MGLAATLARPGGNITGISSWGVELVAMLVRERVEGLLVLTEADEVIR